MTAWRSILTTAGIVSASLGSGCIDFVGTGMDPSTYCDQPHIVCPDDATDTTAELDVFTSPQDSITPLEDVNPPLPDNGLPLVDNGVVGGGPDTMLTDGSSTDVFIEDSAQEDTEGDVPIPGESWIPHQNNGGPDQLKQIVDVAVEEAMIAGEACWLIAKKTDVIEVFLPDAGHPHFRVRVMLARTKSDVSGSFRPLWNLLDQGGLEVRQTNQKHIVSLYAGINQTEKYSETHTLADTEFHEYVWEVERNSNSGVINLKVWLDPPKNAGKEWPAPLWEGVLEETTLEGQVIQLRGQDTCWRKLYIEYPQVLDKFCGDGLKTEGENCVTCPQDLGQDCDSCGDGTKDPAETCETCPQDMPPDDCG